MVRHGAEFEHWLGFSMWRVLPDFLTCPETASDPNRLLRSDLAALRFLLSTRGQAERAWVKTQDQLDALVRLDRHGIITTQRNPTTGHTIFVGTPFSIEVAKANASCHDGAPRYVNLH